MARESNEAIESLPSLPPRFVDAAELANMAAIEIVSASDEPIGLQMPAYLEVEIAGRGISKVAQVAGRQEEDGRRRLISYSLLSPQHDVDGFESWSDGVHELVNIWNAEGDYLSDGSVGEFVILWETEAESSLRAIPGQYRAVQSDDFFDAMLVIEENSSNIGEVIETSSGRRLVASPGDEFLVTNLLLGDDGNMAPVPGTTLFFGEEGQLYLERRPLPGGQYFSGLIVEVDSGDIDTALMDFTVGNENLLAGYRAYFDPSRGFQFLYPEEWTSPIVSDERISTSSISDTLHLNVTMHPNMDQRPVTDLRREVLNEYGQVQILYEDTIQMGASGALRTAYGYEAVDGPHTGVFLVVAQEGNTFVIDVDGPQVDEASVLSVIGTLSESWVSRQVSLGQDPGRWEQITLDGLALHVPSVYQYAKLNNDWHRFTAEDDFTFFALKLEPASGGRILDRIRHWLNVAGKDVNDFVYSEFYTLKIAGRDWLRVDFLYGEEADQQTTGSVMATRVGDKLLFSWAEAPVDSFDVLDRDIFLLVQSDIRPVE